MCESHFMVSDKMVHCKKVVAVFMSQVIKKLCEEKGPRCQTSLLFDRPSSQFKNKYMANFL